jgi:hypothetical protein
MDKQNSAPASLLGLIGIMSLIYGFIFDFCSVLDWCGVLHGVPEHMGYFTIAGVILTLIAFIAIPRAEQLARMREEVNLITT